MNSNLDFDIFIYMDLELIEKIDKLNNDIKNIKEYKEFLIAKNDLENNEDAIRLSIKKDNLIMDLESLIKLNQRNSSEYLKTQIEIKEINDSIKNLEVSKIYKEKENKLNEIIEYINKEIFIK